MRSAPGTVLVQPSGNRLRAPQELGELPKDSLNCGNLVLIAAGLKSARAADVKAEHKLKIVALRDPVFHHVRETWSTLNGQTRFATIGEFMDDIDAIGICPLPNLLLLDGHGVFLAVLRRMPIVSNGADADGAGLCWPFLGSTIRAGLLAVAWKPSRHHTTAVLPRKLVGRVNQNSNSPIPLSVRPLDRTRPYRCLASLILNTPFFFSAACRSLHRMSAGLSEREGPDSNTF